MKPQYNLLRSIPLLLLLLLGGCKKPGREDALSQEEEQEVALTTARNDMQALFSFDDAFDNTLGVNAEVGIGGTGVFFRPTPLDTIPACVTVTTTRLVAGQPFPVRVIVDFGPSGCLNRDGRVRRGRIITEYSGRLMEPGNQAVTTFDNYRIDSLRIEGTQVVENTTLTAPPGAPPHPRQFRISVQNARVTRPNGTSMQWSGERKILQIDGTATPPPFDDIFHITGSARGTLRTATVMTTWESNIEAPLRKRFNCRWITAGRVSTRRGGLPGGSPWVARLEYGNGNCDNLAIISLNNSSYQILLP